MTEQGCFIHRIEFYNDTEKSESIRVDSAFSDIHILHSQLQRIGDSRQCKQGTVIVAFDIRDNIITALVYNEPQFRIQSPIPPSVIEHSQIWEEAIIKLSEVPNNKFPVFNNALGRKIIKSARLAYDNGKALLDDAELLFDNKRFTRAGSLAILAFEEFSKSFILRLCLLQKRWDREMYLALRNHANKHAILYAALMTPQSTPSLFSVKNPFPTSRIESIIKTFSDKKHLDKLKQNLQFSDIKKDGTCDDISTDKDNIFIGIYLAKLAWYYLSYTHDNINIDNVRRIEEGHFINRPSSNTNIPEDKIFITTHSIFFMDSTICTVQYTPPEDKKNDILRYEIPDTYLTPLYERAENILEGKGAVKFSQEAIDFWKHNQQELDVCAQMEAEQKRLGYRYSPYLAAIKEILGK